jgi:hypothetical protein
MVMGMTDKILLVLLLLAVAGFPIAVFLYFGTANRQGGWAEVKCAAFVAAFSLLILGGINLWPEFELRHIWRAIQHPLALSSIVFVVLIGLAQFALKVWIETHDIH